MIYKQAPNTWYSAKLFYNRGRAFDVIVKIHVIKSQHSKNSRDKKSIMERQDQKIISL